MSAPRSDDASSIVFRKVQGLGNDFVLFDGLDGPLPLDQLLDPRTTIHLCDRHFGVGADGLLLLLPPEAETAQARMRIINADGSEPEMCGNGLRCVAKVAHDYHDSLRGMDRLTFETGAGRLTCALQLDAAGQVCSVRVDMGRPSLDRAALPMTGEGTFREAPLEVAGQTLRSTAVSMGNPHLITFLAPDGDPRGMAETLGPLLERHPWFPRRTNVEFARPQGDALELWVWERGCGLTQACGTGACATAVAAVATGRHPAERPLTVRLPGGELTIEVAADLERVWMTGPAEEVFTGTIVLPRH